MSIFQRAAVLFWGVISHAYEILPKILAALKLLGFDRWEAEIRDALHKGGLAIDDFVELHAVKIISIACLFERIAGLFASKAALLRELHEEGTRPRTPREEDLFDEARVAYYLRAFASHDAQMVQLQGAGEEVTLALADAAAVGVRPDVSQSPTLDC
jgi:hypothetical protein